MSDVTPRLQLPFLSVGQAQKEVTHNEALARLDMLIQPVIEGVRNDPPQAPAIGQCWLVEAIAQGPWAGMEDHIAQWTAGGWRFVPAADGYTIWHRATGERMTRESGSWTTAMTASSLRIGGKKVVGSQQTAISVPEGGMVADIEARTSIALIIAALQAHGLISD